jgi:hypothetical protein
MWETCSIHIILWFQKNGGYRPLEKLRIKRKKEIERDFDCNLDGAQLGLGVETSFTCLTGLSRL